MIRERFALTPDLELEIVEQPDGVLLCRRDNQPSMIKVDGLRIHQVCRKRKRSGIGSLMLCTTNAPNPCS